MFILLVTGYLFVFAVSGESYCFTEATASVLGKFGFFVKLNKD
jgi:hypothetical protein